MQTSKSEFENTPEGCEVKSSVMPSFGKTLVSQDSGEITERVNELSSRVVKEILADILEDILKKDGKNESKPKPQTVRPEALAKISECSIEIDTNIKDNSKIQEGGTGSTIVDAKEDVIAQLPTTTKAAKNRTIFEAAIFIVSKSPQPEFISIDSIANSLNMDPVWLSEFFEKSALFDVENSQVRLDYCQFQLYVFQDSNASLRTKLNNKQKRQETNSVFSMRSAKDAVIFSGLFAVICKGSGRNNNCLRLSYGKTLIKVPIKTKWSSMKYTNGMSVSVDFEITLTSELYNASPLKIQGISKSKRNGPILFEKGRHNLELKDQLANAKKSKFQQIITQDKSGNTKVQKTLAKQPKSKKKEEKSHCDIAITPEEMRWRVVNFSMIQLCKKKQIHKGQLYTTFCTQIDESIVNEEKFEACMSLQIFEFKNECYSRKEDLLSLEEYLLSNPAIKEMRSDSKVTDGVLASRDYTIMVEEKYLVITNLDVYLSRAGWVLFTFPGSNRTLGLKHKCSDLHSQERVYLFFHMNGSTHVHRTDNPPPPLAFSENDSDDSEEGADCEDDDMGYLLADMSGNVMIIP